MIRVIYNPAAGPRAVNRISRAKEILSEAGISFEVRETTGPGDALLLSREAAHERFSTVLAVGGDEAEEAAAASGAADLAARRACLHCLFV